MTRAASEPGGSGGERHLPPERLEIIKSQARERAHELRAQMLREFGGWLVRRPKEILRWFVVLRQRRKAVRELQGLDSRTLHDMGIARSEIEYLVAGGDPERRVPRKAVMRAASAAADAARGEAAPTARRAA